MESRRALAAHVAPHTFDQRIEHLRGRTLQHRAGDFPGRRLVEKLPLPPPIVPLALRIASARLLRRRLRQRLCFAQLRFAQLIRELERASNDKTPPPEGFTEKQLEELRSLSSDELVRLSEMTEPRVAIQMSEPPSRNSTSVSTCPATVDACGGAKSPLMCAGLLATARTVQRPQPDTLPPRQP